MNSNSKITVITRTKNRPLLLGRVAVTLELQSFKNFEWLIINDGGTLPDIDSTLQPRIINLPKSIGRGGAAHEGLHNATGDYILFHDDDDSLKESALEKLAEALDKRPDCVGVICGYQVIHEDCDKGSFKPTVVGVSHLPNLPPTISDLAYVNTLLTISTLFRRETAIKAGGMNIHLDALEDWDLWLRLILEGDFTIVKEVLAYQHIRKISNTAYTQSTKLEHGLARIKLLNHYLREDIKNGRQGLGHLLNVQNRQMVEELSTLTMHLRKLKKRIMFWQS